MLEDARPIAGWDGYAITIDGRPLSCKYRKGRRGPWREIKSKPSRVGGHRRVMLCRDGKHKWFFVHRLVAEAFIGPCPEGMECCHNDGDGSNNHVDNLRWDTHKNNLWDRNKHGTRPLGETVGGAVMTEEAVCEVRLLVPQGVKQTDLAKRFGVTPCCINSIIKRRTWKHVALLSN